MDSGVYALVISIRNPARVRIGKLGTISFPPGWYVYVGSAMNGLSARIQRHCSSEKRLHWHVDYLLNAPEARITEIFRFPTEQRLECTLSDLIAKNAESNVPGFGCSDCNCRSHLYFFSGLNVVKSSLVQARMDLMLSKRVIQRGKYCTPLLHQP